MAETVSPGRGNTPTAVAPERQALEVNHAPAVPSPLNPAAATKAPKPLPPAREREQREKKESLKKREATGNTRGNTPDVKNKKQKGPTVPSPMRYSIPEPRPSDYEPPKDPVFMSREPAPIYAPDGKLELKRPIDQYVSFTPARAAVYSRCPAPRTRKHTVTHTA
jgi:COMPASS component BRE2